MSRQIYVNLPVKELKRSVEFFTQLGFTFNPQFTDENATCMIVADDIYVMLLVEKFFQSFTDKPVCDAAKATGSDDGLVLRKPRRSGRSGAQSACGGRHRAQSAAGSRLHVRTRFRGSGWPHLGTVLHGTRRPPG